MPAKETGGSKTAAFAVWFVLHAQNFANCTVCYTESSDKWVPLYWGSTVLCAPILIPS